MMHTTEHHTRTFHIGLVESVKSFGGVVHYQSATAGRGWLCSCGDGSKALSTGYDALGARNAAKRHKREVAALAALRAHLA